MPPIAPSRSRLALLLLLAVGLSACAPARVRARTDVVRSVSFQGNGEGVLPDDTDYVLRGQMEQQETAWGLSVPVARRLVEPRTLDEDALVRDAYRLEVWYAHHGWYDARVLGWSVRTVRPDRRRRSRVVDVVGVVDPGPRSLVRQVTTEGLGANASGVGRQVIRTGALREGDPYVHEYAEQLRQQLADELRDSSFAYARVELSVTAHPAQEAVDVTLSVDQGPSAVLGEVEVSGTQAVSEAIVRATMGLEPGEPYAISDLRRARNDLFALGTFSVVEVVPDLSDRSRERVPVQVKLVESRFGEFRVGGGLTLDGTTLVPRLSSSVSHVNLLGRLVRGELGGELGVSTQLGRSGLATRGFPTYEAHLSGTWPRLFHRRVDLTARASIDQDLQSGELPYRQPRGSLGLAWRASSRVTVTTGIGVEHFQYLELSEDALLAARAAFGTGFENPYQLAHVEAGFTYDSRNDKIQTTRNSLVDFRVRQAARTLVGDYAYTDLAMDLRRFFTLDPSTGPLHAILPGRVLAFRLRGRTLRPWAGSALPYPELAFLGGDSSLRGFLRDQVGPYDSLCTYLPDQGGSRFTGVPGEGTEVDLRYLPHGGASMAAGSFEIRHPAPLDIAAASLVLPFVDVGVLVPEADTLQGAMLRWGAGVGFRYRTLVGPVRFDLAFRPLYPEDYGPSSVIGCQSGDSMARPIDWLSTRATRRSPSDRQVPFAVVGYLALSEAF